MDLTKTVKRNVWRFFLYLRLIVTIKVANPINTREYVNRSLIVMYAIGATSFRKVTKPPSR